MQSELVVANRSVIPLNKIPQELFSCSRRTSTHRQIISSERPTTIQL